jgi:glycerol-3-phosphate dehydrogenase
MKVAVIGGGINGVMCAWALARQGAQVSLFERGSLMSATSAASSKMLHGGLRYLEQGHFGLVRESLIERAWWLENAPELTRQFALVIPVYRGARRGAWLIGAGVKLYDFLARGSGFPKSQWLEPRAVIEACPTLKTEGLKGGWQYWDGQMDDRALGLWAADQATRAGVRIVEHTPVSAVRRSGELRIGEQWQRFDCIINATGPWAATLLEQSGIDSAHALDLVRGTHLVLGRTSRCGCVLQSADTARVIFVLPQGEHTLLGTTEVLQPGPEPCQSDASEIDTLLAAYNAHFTEPISRADVIDSYAGVRPVVKSRGDISRASRESVIERRGRLITVFGGKWTTARALSYRVISAVEAILSAPTRPPEPG